MSLFGQAPSSGTSLFGQSSQNTQQQSGGPFGSTNTTTQAKPGLLGSLNTNTASSQPQQQGGGLFGSTTNTSATQGAGLFGASGSQPAQGSGLFGSTQPQPSGGGLFGNTQNNQQQGGTSLFGSSQPQQAGGGLFGNSQPQTQQTSSLFGNAQNQTQSQQQQSSSLFGNLQSQPQLPQQQVGGSLFGGLNAANQQQQQQAQNTQGITLGQSLNQSRIFQASELVPRQKSVTDQIELALTKWNPASSNTPFRTYLYNAVPPESVPFYGPTPLDDEVKWEEALSKKPFAGSVPILVQGFRQLGERMVQQIVHLETLRGRLHEINSGLTMLLQKHDLQISIRAADCRRRHQRLAKQSLNLAAKTQVLRNRGFAMDGAEEMLRQKLLTLEKKVLDPALNSRSEEIWARMVNVRERGRHLQREFERAGKDMTQTSVSLDEQVLNKAKKILEDYSSQLAHLAKELAQIQNDWAEWEKGSTGR